MVRDIGKQGQDAKKYSIHQMAVHHKKGKRFTEQSGGGDQSGTRSVKIGIQEGVY